MEEDKKVLAEETEIETPVEEVLTEEEVSAEEDIKEAEEPANPQWMLLRALVGGYLIYLAYSLIRDAYKNNDLRWYFILFAILFAGSGIFMIIYFVRRYLKEIKGED